MVKDIIMRKKEKRKGALSLSELSGIVLSALFGIRRGSV
jgi:hypothetical protein